MITETQLANLKIQANAAISTADIIKLLIESDKDTPDYKKAVEGEDYYKRNQKIKSEDFTTTTVLESDPTDPDKTIENVFHNPNRSNQRIQHRFLFNHVEQKVSYIAGREPSITVDGAKAHESGESGNDQWQLQNELAKTTNTMFRKQLLSLLRKASLEGKSWLHEYKDKNGKLKQAVIPRTEGVAIYDSSYEQEIVEFIRYYPVVLNIAGKELIGTKAEWWTDQDVTYWIDEGNGRYVKDSSYETNPAPHYWEIITVTGPDGVTQIEKSRTAKSWGKIPFIELANNSDKMTDLEIYKDLIDAYDLVASKGTNNLLDFNEFYAIIQGFGGEVASAVVRKLEVNRAVSINGDKGKVELKQYDLTMTGRIDWLKELWNAIHFFGCAVDTNADRIGNAPSGVSLEFQYSLLDLKANNMITEAELVLNDHFWFITQDINRQNSKNYDPEEVAIQFNKSKITNNLETVTMITQSDNIVPEKLLLQAHPLVKDADQAYKDLLEQRKEKMAQQREEFGNFGTTNPLGAKKDDKETE